MANQYTKSKETGIPYIMSEETRKKKSISASKDNLKRFSNPEYREKISKSMRQAVINNPESYTSKNVCGRIKIYEYNGVKLHGKWELEVAKWMDSQNIKWERKVKPFEYFWKNSIHLYFPDFYLPTLDKYVEVKGYETERDLCKWKSVPNLIVLKKNEIKLIKENKFSLL